MITTILTPPPKLALTLAFSAAMLAGCNGGGSDDSAQAADTNSAVLDAPADLGAGGPTPPGANPPGATPPPNNSRPPNNDGELLDEALTELITALNLDADPLAGRSVPNITSPAAQLGKKLFFSKSLGGGLDTACASCHHPTLGGADELALPIGVEAVQPEVLGNGRVNSGGLPFVPRNSPTIFNTVLWDTGLFWDSRIESLGKETGENGAASGISTPDSGFGISDVNAGVNLATAQARFPVTSTDEMKTDSFENGSSNDLIRAHLAARIGDYGTGQGELSLNQWLQEFQAGFSRSDDAETLITYENIAHAIGEYERSMLFIDSPWQQYLNGDQTALSDQQKRGALLFFRPNNERGAGCAACHNGTLFSDGRHHTVAFPQFGPGNGDGNNDDFGRERVTGSTDDRYRFRTPSLLNIALTAPYGHAGTYKSLEKVVRHYRNPNRSVENFFEDARWCQLPQFENIADCNALYPDAFANSELALNKLRAEQQNNTSLLQRANLNDREVGELVAFLHALTDECATSRACLAPWIADEVTDNPDNNVLIGTDADGNLL